MNNRFTAGCLVLPWPARLIVSNLSMTILMLTSTVMMSMCSDGLHAQTDAAVARLPAESSIIRASQVSESHVLADVQHQGTSQLLKPLPDGLTSFGAITLGEFLYVFSGHHGAAHSFGKHVLSNHFRRIRFADPAAHWEELAMHHPAQSVSLVTDGQYVYRIAGLSFRNSETEVTDFDSTPHFARFDPILNQWEDLAELPEGRSSLDAAVVGRSIYVVGGWNLQGNSSTSAHWHQTMLRFDLDAPEAGWQILPGPGYDIRALSVAAHGNSLYAMGGMTPRGISRRVCRFDTTTQQWSEGPELPADHRTAGFATSAFASQGRLYNAGSSGILYRLSDDETQWEIADRLLFPRNFLRLILGGPTHLLAVGGTGGTGRSAAVELIDVSASTASSDSSLDLTAQLATWSVEFAGNAHEHQSVWTDGCKLIAVGGGVGLVSEVFEFDLTLQTARQLSSLPVPIRDATLLANSQTSEHQSLVIMGGMSGAASEDSSLSDCISSDVRRNRSSLKNAAFHPQSGIFEYDFATDQWTPTPVKMPFPLGMHTSIRFQEAFWTFGGVSIDDQSSTNELKDNTQIIHWWGDESSPGVIPNATLPTPRRLGGCAVVGNELFLIGGVNADNQIVSQVDVFNLQTRSWRQITPPQQSRMKCSVVSVGQFIYLFGGCVVTAEGQATIHSLERYDVERDQWQVIAEQLPGIDGSMRMLSSDSRLLFFGIESDSSKNVPNIARFALYAPVLPSSDQSHFNNVSGVMVGDGVGRESEAVRSALMMMRRDIDKDGKISRSELGSRMEDFFNKADLDQDDFLTFEEIVRSLQSE